MSDYSNDYRYTYDECTELSIEYDHKFGYGNQVSFDRLPEKYQEDESRMIELYRQCLKTGKTIREYLKLPHLPNDPDVIYD